MNPCKRDSMKSIINEPQNLSTVRGNINLLLSKEGIFPFSLINEPPSSHFMTETRNLPFSCIIHRSLENVRTLLSPRIEFTFPRQAPVRVTIPRSVTVSLRFLHHVH